MKLYDLKNSTRPRSAEIYRRNSATGGSSTSSTFDIYSEKYVSLREQGSTDASTLHQQTATRSSTPHVCSLRKRRGQQQGNGHNSYTQELSRVRSATTVGRSRKHEQLDRDVVACGLNSGEDSASTASTQCASCGEWRRREEQEELRILRKKVKEMEEELKSKNFTVDTIQRNLQNVCRLLAADRQEITLLRRREPADTAKLKKELRESEDDRETVMKEVEKLRNTNLLLQQKVVRLREMPFVDQRIRDRVDVT